MDTWKTEKMEYNINPLNAELNPICHMLALLGAQPILHVSRIRVKMDIMDVGSDGLRWLKLAQNYVQLWSLVLLTLDFQSLQRGNS